MSRLTINSNIASLNAQRNFGNATKKLSESYTRLSSGLRINRASDDAAGLSISESLKADTRIFNQGVRNLNDGASALNIADGALSELSNIMIRLNELAEQSANGTLGNKQRQALDQEAQSLSKEYNRIARTTEFNGRKLFDGDFGDLSLAAGGSRDTLIVEDLGGAIGDRTFNSNITFAVGDGNAGLDIGDLNNDGIIDIVTANQNDQNISILMGNGDGTFKVQNTLAVSVFLRYPKIFDVNSDGNMDIVTGNQSGQSITTFLGNGNGTFKAGNSISLLGVHVFAIDLAFINNDSYVDVIAANSLGGTTLLLGNGDGTFKNHLSFSSGVNTSHVEAGDLNNDGIVDLVSSYAGAVNQLRVLIGKADGTYSSLSSYFVGSDVNEFILKDFNNDGILDVASANRLNFNISINLGNGDGSFKSRQIFETGETSDLHGLTSSDFNGDGNLDISATGTGSDSLKILLGNNVIMMALFYLQFRIELEMVHLGLRRVTLIMMA